MSIWTELLVIVTLTLANALFSGAEIAILSARKTRLRELAEQGNRSAIALVRMRDNPERLLATLQIGITVIGSTAAVFGGATVSRALATVLEQAGAGRYAEDLALAAVVGIVSYLSLVVGELVPKSLALRSAERYGLFVARPLLALSWLLMPLVWFLTASSNLLLRAFRDRTTFTEARLSKEELQQLVDEAATVGALDKDIGEIAYRALDFGDVRVGALMVPRAEMVTLARSASREHVRDVLIHKGHARFPVHEVDAPDDVCGYVTARELVRLLVEPGSRTLADIVRPGLFVPEGARAAAVLAEMQQKRDHLALVVDEQGTVSGLVTIEDLVEELVGEIFAEHEVPVERIRRQPDGTALVRGRVPVHEVNRELGIELPEGRGFTTMAGLAMSLAGTIPRVGVRLSVDRIATLEIVEASERRVAIVRVAPTRKPSRPTRGT